MKISRLIIGLLLFITAPPVVITAYESVKLTINLMPDWLLPFGIGTIIGLYLDQKFIRWLPGVEVFEHEFTHAVAAKMFFRKIIKFKVTLTNGGSVVHKGKFGGTFGDDFIGFAPYILPTFTVLLVVLRPLLWDIPPFWYDIVVGFTFGFHTWSTIREFMLGMSPERFRSAATGKWVRSDIASRGYIYSFIFLLTFTLAIHTLLLFIMLKGFYGTRLWWDMLISEFPEFYRNFFQYISGIL